MGKEMRFPHIEIARMENGLTKGDIAEAMNVSRDTYRNWINSGNMPSSKLVELSKMLNRSVDYLLGLSGERSA